MSLKTLSIMVFCSTMKYLLMQVVSTLIVPRGEWFARIKCSGSALQLAKRIRSELMCCWLRWAIQLAKDQGIEKPLFRTDSAVVVECLKQNCYRASIELIMQDCRQLLLGFSSFHVMFVKRTENGNAHQLVGLAQSLGNKQWLNHEQIHSLSLLCNWPMAYTVFSI